MRQAILVSSLLFGCWGEYAAAQTTASSPEPEINLQLSEESENPVSRAIVLPFRYEALFDDGAYKDTQSTFKLSNGLIPFVLTDDWALITRNNIPFVVLPPKKFGDHWTDGFDNATSTFFLSPQHGKVFFWGVGPALSYPATTKHALGQPKWGAGPSVAFLLKAASRWQIGLVVNNIWSFDGGAHNDDRTNALMLNPMVSFQLGNGWSLGTSPNIKANWISNPGQQWTVPVGGGLSKTFHIGKRGVKLSLAAYANVIRPRADHDTWLAQFTVTVLLPK